jgi:hypothetical protein
MGRWLSNISLKYKFWAVNAVAFITTLLLVLYALQIEQRARADDAEAFHQARQQLLAGKQLQASRPSPHRLRSTNCWPSTPAITPSPCSC